MVRAADDEYHGLSRCGREAAVRIAIGADAAASGAQSTLWHDVRPRAVVEVVARGGGGVDVALRAPDELIGREGACAGNGE